MIDDKLEEVGDSTERNAEEVTTMYNTYVTLLTNLCDIKHMNVDKAQ